MSGCQNPVTLCSIILSSLSPSLSRIFRKYSFFFRSIHVSEIHLRELSPKTCDKNFLFSAVKCTTDIVLQFGNNLLVLHPTLNRELQISVGTAGPQPRALDFSGHSQTPRVPDHSGHCHSTIKGGAIPASQGFRGAFAKLSRIFRSHP